MHLSRIFATKIFAGFAKIRALLDIFDHRTNPIAPIALCRTHPVPSGWSAGHRQTCEASSRLQGMRCAGEVGGKVVLVMPDEPGAQHGWRFTDGASTPTETSGLSNVPAITVTCDHGRLSGAGFVCDRGGVSRARRPQVRLARLRLAAVLRLAVSPVLSASLLAAATVARAD